MKSRLPLQVDGRLVRTDRGKDAAPEVTQWVFDADSVLQKERLLGYLQLPLSLQKKRSVVLWVDVHHHVNGRLITPFEQVTLCPCGGGGLECHPSVRSNISSAYLEGITKELLGGLEHIF